MRRHSFIARLTTVIGSLALVVAAGACGSKGGANASPTTKPVTSTTAKRALNPNYDSGETITITPTGFQPKELVAQTGLKLTFVNHTAIAQHVQFEHSRDAKGNLIASGAIPPGKSWSYTPENWESATYHSVDQPSLRGQIQIQPPAEP